MEQPTACRPTRRRSSRRPISTSGIRDRHALPSRTAHRLRRAARLTQIGGGQPSRRPIAGGPQSSRASLDRSGAARLARLIARTSRRSPALLRRDLRPRSLRGRSTTELFVRPGVPPLRLRDSPSPPSTAPVRLLLPNRPRGLVPCTFRAVTGLSAGRGFFKSFGPRPRSPLDVQPRDL